MLPATTAPMPGTSWNSSAVTAGSDRATRAVHSAGIHALRRPALGDPAGQVDGGLLAHLGNAERVQHPRQRPPARPFDRSLQVLGALAGEPVEADEVVDRQAVEVAARLDQAARQQLLQHGPAGALDVHPAAAGEMGELLGQPRRAFLVGAVVADRALVADYRRPADRARRRHLEFALGTRPPLRQRPNHFRDDVAGLLQHDPVPYPQVLAPDLVQVVERGSSDGRAGHLRRAHVRHGRQRPGPADVRHDVLEDRLDLLGRELVGDRPARGARHHAEPLLLVVPIDLHDHAVGLVRQLVALLAPLLQEAADAVDVEAFGPIRVHREAEGGESGERLGLAGDRSARPSGPSSISW